VIRFRLKLPSSECKGALIFLISRQIKVHFKSF
jgi:hypothetical protein